MNDRIRYSNSLRLKLNAECCRWNDDCILESLQEFLRENFSLEKSWKLLEAGGIWMCPWRFRIGSSLTEMLERTLAHGGNVFSESNKEVQRSGPTCWFLPHPGIPVGVCMQSGLAFLFLPLFYLFHLFLPSLLLPFCYPLAFLYVVSSQWFPFLIWKNSNKNTAFAFLHAFLPSSQVTEAFQVLGWRCESAVQYLTPNNTCEAEK